MRFHCGGLTAKLCDDRGEGWRGDPVCSPPYSKFLSPVHRQTQTSKPNPRQIQLVHRHEQTGVHKQEGLPVTLNQQQLTQMDRHWTHGQTDPRQAQGHTLTIQLWGHSYTGA